MLAGISVEVFGKHGYCACVNSEWAIKRDVKNGTGDNCVIRDIRNSNDTVISLK
jgi:hypothetical protein